MSKKISIIYDQIRWEEKKIYQEAMNRKLDIQLIDAKEINFKTDTSKEELQKIYGEVVLQRCLGFYRGLHITAFLETKGITVVNKFNTINTCGNKLLTTLKLIENNLPIPKTSITFTTKSSLSALEELGYPAINKPLIGSWGRMVTILKDKQTANAIFEMKEIMNNPINNIHYNQEMIQCSGEDIRCIVIDNKLITAISRKPAKGEWRANVAKGATVSKYEITPELNKLVTLASKSVGGGILGVDIMDSGNGLVINEINGTVEFKGASTISDIDIGKIIIDYVTSK